MMTLTRQVWLMLFGVLLFALIGSVATHTLMARQSLQTQLQVRNDDGAMMLALALSQQRPAPARSSDPSAKQASTRSQAAAKIRNSVAFTTGLTWVFSR